MAATTEQDIAQSDTLTVCLVDDDPMMGALFSRVIRRSGCNVIAAGSAGEAESVMAEHQIDIVLSDLMMPHASDGEHFLGNIVKNLPGVPVIMMSGNMCSDTQARLVALGATACLVKPFTADVFNMLISGLDGNR